MDKCKKCGKKVDKLEVFPEDRCLECYEKDFDKLPENEKMPVFNNNLLNV